MNLFESEIEEGFKKNICLICHKPNCKHLQRWRTQNGIPFFTKEELKRKRYPQSGPKPLNRLDDAIQKGNKAGYTKEYEEQTALKVGKGVMGWNKSGIAYKIIKQERRFEIIKKEVK